MAFSLSLSGLYSRVVRNRLFSSLGPRALGSNPLTKVLQAGKELALINIGGSFKGFAVGLIFSSIPSLTWSLTGLWEMFTTASLELYYFDWNMPDDTIDQQAKAQWAAYGSILGGTAGNAFGYFVCGVVPASSMMVFNRDLAVYVLKEVGEEGFEELTANFSLVLQQSIRNAGMQAFGWLYKGARRWLKDPNNPVGNLIFGSRANEVRQKWGAANSPSWSFASAIETQIEKIPNQFWQDFAEEFIDEAIDACIEAGYIVAQSAEAFYARQRLAEQFSKDAARVVEVQPNRDNEREKIILAGPESDVRAQLPAVLANHQMVESRDIGQIVGEPLDDFVRPRPFVGIRLKFQLYSVPSPPYAARGDDRLVRVTVSLSNVKRSKIDWETLRLACGGPNGYLWGRWRAHAILDDGHPLTVYGSTKDGAEDQLRAFLALTDSTIKTLSITEETKEGERLRNPKMYKETTRVYPGHVNIINRDRLQYQDRGHPSLEGNFIDKKARIDLWRGVEPPDFEDVVRELLRHSDLGDTVSPP